MPEPLEPEAPIEERRIPLDDEVTLVENDREEMLNMVEQSLLDAGLRLETADEELVRIQNAIQACFARMGIEFISPEPGGEYVLSPTGEVMLDEFGRLETSEERLTWAQAQLDAIFARMS